MEINNNNAQNSKIFITTYRPSIFYNPSSILDFTEFKNYVVKESNNIITEQKYKSSNKNWNRREPSKKSLLWILNNSKLKDTKIVHRFAYYTQKELFQVLFFHNWYLAWCDIDISKEKDFINKYNLEQIK